MLIEMYEGDSGKGASAERRYSPATCTGSREQTITGNPDAAHISYNLARIQQTLRVTPAMEAGVSDHVWSIEEIVGLLDWAAAQPARAGDSN